MPCRVCELVNDDTTSKPVVWCDICKAYICKEHNNDWIARPKAAAIELAMKSKEVLKSLISKVA